MLKNGSQHAQSLKDGRQVFINGQIAADVGEHPAFRRTLETVGGLFDFAARPENVELMTFEPSDASGGRANRIWQLPQSYEESGSAPARARSLGRTPCRFPRPRARPCRLLSLGHGHGASTCSRPMTGRAPALLRTIIGTRETTTSISPMCSSIPRRIARRVRASNAIAFCPRAWSIRTPKASRSAAARCWRPAASSPTRCSSPAFSRFAKAKSPTRCPSLSPMNAKGLKILSRKSYEEGATERVRLSARDPLRRERRGALL